MVPGDYVCFPAGTRVGHCFENPYDEPCRLLAIGGRDDGEIAGYPDSGKMKLRALGVIVPMAEHSLDYWEGERPDEVLGASGARVDDAAHRASGARTGSRVGGSVIAGIAETCAVADGFVDGASAGA